MSVVMDFVTVIFVVFLTPVVNLIQINTYHRHQHCPDKVLDSRYLYRILQERSRLDCATECGSDVNCMSYQHNSYSRTCNPNSLYDLGDCSWMTRTANVTYYERERRCVLGGRGDTCVCARGYLGINCDQIMTDCSESREEDGIYYIQPEGSPLPFPIFCHVLQKGHRNMIFLRRSRDVMLDWNWQQYRDGFGQLDGDYWLGLEKVHQLTKQKTYQFGLQFTVDGNRCQQYFRNFKVDSETQGYRMSFKPVKYAPKRRCASCDRLAHLDGSTGRNDYLVNGSCAQMKQSWWWFNACADCKAGEDISDITSGARGYADHTPVPLRIWLMRK